jgi:endonuclease/exonuclease/phosphatase family metal-dependent hydrolase
MRIATFNLESLDVPPKAAISLEDRIAILRPQLARMAADVVCFQEVNAQQENAGSERRLLALELLLQETPYAEFERSVTGTAGGRSMADVHNLVVLSRFPIQDSGEIWNKFVDAPLYRCVTAIPTEDEARHIRWDRPILKTVIQLDGVRMLHVLNVHLRAPLAAPVAGQKDAPFVWSSTQGWAEGYFLAAMKRAGQALELRLAIDQIFDSDPDALIAVCGDFNAEDHETALRIVLASEEDTGSGRLATRSLVPLERSIPQDRRFTTLHHARPLMLDHILVSHTLLGFFRHLEIHNEALADELIGYTKIDKPPDSFHAPMVAELALD